jgi:hypothetical protein
MCHCQLLPRPPVAAVPARHGGVQRLSKASTAALDARALLLAVHALCARLRLRRQRLDRRRRQRERLRCSADGSVAVGVHGRHCADRSDGAGRFSDAPQIHRSDLSLESMRSRTGPTRWTIYIYMYKYMYMYIYIYIYIYRPPRGNSAVRLWRVMRPPAPSAGRPSIRSIRQSTPAPPSR